MISLLLDVSDAKSVFKFSRVEYAGGMLVYILPVFVTFVKFQKVILQDGKKHCYK